ncbi:MAG: class I SAM-dependent methyltransferase [Clostridia bacterium]|nr:class I SAM-dependent methyltransferase [Clostridia bacterium]
MEKNKIIAFFDDMASDWDAMQVRNEDVIAEILQKGGIIRRTKVLDVACGTGVLFPDYISLGAEVTGIDISANMAEKAREKYPDIKVICGDAAEYSFEDAFDAVMIYNAFPHFTDPDKLIKNLSAALREKGRFTVAHGMSEKELAKCHSTVAKDVSLPLPSKERLADIMSDIFDVDVMISDDEKYIVSGLKK